MIEIYDEINNLIKTLPESGKANTDRGEVVRAFNKIVYDYYNNGFGNNWVYPIMMLAKLEDKFIGSSRIIESDLIIYSLGICCGSSHKVESELSNLQHVVLDILPRLYDTSYGLDMWDPNTWTFTDDNSKTLFTYDFTDMLELILSILSENDSVDSFIHIMNENRKYISRYGNYPINPEEIKNSLIEFGIDEYEANEYANNYKYGLSDSRPLMY